MKRLVLLTPHYLPEEGAAAQRATAMAEYLAAHGWQVSVVTLQPHYPQNRIYDGYDTRSPDRREERSVTVTRLRPWIVPKSSLALRLLSETLFCLQALPHALRTPADVVLASSPYMFLGPAGLLVGRCKGAKFIWDVRDLTWLYPRAAGKKTFGLDKMLERQMLAVARHADGLTTATEGLLSYFVARPECAIVLPNGVSDKRFDVLSGLPPPDPACPRVLYAGLFGYNHGLSTLIEAANRLPDIPFTLAGDGPEGDALRRQAAALGLENVTFTGYLSGARLLEEYRRATLLVSHVRKNPLFEWTQPAKLWEYMATGRPVIHAGEGEVVWIIQEHDIALTVPPEDPDALAASIRTLLCDPARSATLGARGQAFVAAHRKRGSILERLSTLLDAVVEATPLPEAANAP